jgi:uncharacterized circularly permuted ATP-grasp superfamily protein
LAEPGELEVAEGRLWLRPRGEARRSPVDVVYRRTDDAAAGGPIGRLLLEPWRNGRLGVLNAYGTTVADDKLTHAYVDEIIRFYLGEEPELGSVPTYDLSDPEVFDRVRPRLRELVIKPRSGYGGIGVVIAPHAEPEDLDAVCAEVEESPGDFIAQETIALSSHPTAIDGRLVPRHVDLRPFIFCTGDEAEVMPGGLTRVALDEGALVVNSTQNGGAKDTWVLRA